MNQISNKGECFLCHQTIDYRMMTRHVKSCLDKSLKLAPGITPELTPVGESKEKVFLFKIVAERYFWLFVEINGSATLEDLDYFLRKIWLECCHHLSRFVINGISYVSMDEMHGARMSKKIHQLFKNNSTFDHQYDFGSTTDLSGTLVSSRPGELLNRDLRLIARNHFPEDMTCIGCDGPAAEVCSMCYEYFCEKCPKEHLNCRSMEEYLLPVVNSPRMGVCGYSGPSEVVGS